MRPQITPRQRKAVALGLVAATIAMGSGIAGAATAHSVTKGSLPKGTASAVSTLILREEAVVGQLKAFQKLPPKANVVPWAVKLDADATAENAAAKALARDLTPPKPTPKPKPKPKPPTSNAFTFKDDNGNPYTVAQVGYWDPAQPANQFDAASAGTRLVAIEFRITDTGTQATSDDANNDASVVGSNNQTYSPAFNDVAECTNFNSGEYQLDPGQSTTGCVVFQLPDGVRLSKAEWSPNGGFGGSFGTWTFG